MSSIKKKKLALNHSHFYSKLYTKLCISLLYWVWSSKILFIYHKLAIQPTNGADLISITILYLESSSDPERKLTIKFSLGLNYCFTREFPDYISAVAASMNIFGSDKLSSDRPIGLRSIRTQRQKNISCVNYTKY